MAEIQIKSHDGFFKKLFSKKDEVREFLAKTTPTEILNKLHLDTLQLDTTNYVDDKLKEYFADVVYNCNYTFNDNETKQVKITFLFEHKSYREIIPHLQLGSYIFKVLDTQVNQELEQGLTLKDIRLKPIIPIIFYHGTTKWNKQPFENYFEGMDEFLIQFLPRFDYHLIDMKNYENFEITQLFQKRQMQIGLLLMKNIFNEPSLLDLLKNIFTNPLGLSDKEQERKFFENISSYIYNLSNRNLLTQIMELMKTLRTQHSKGFISIAEHLKMKGKNEGIETTEKRIAFNLILKGENNKYIMEATGLTNEQINHLRKTKKYNIDFGIN